METGQTIYIIDDDASVRNGLSRLLRAAGYVVLLSASADDFLSTLQPDASGCILLDARMPGQTNQELKTELDQRNIHIPLIMISADDDLETRRSAQQLGAQGFFRKPVDGVALLDAIRWAISSSKR